MEDENREFTIDDLMDTFSTYLQYQWIKYPDLGDFIEYDDLYQECLLSFLDIMKSTGEVRLDHYNKYYFYDDQYHWTEVQGLVKRCAYQAAHNYFRYNSVKHRPISLNRPAHSDNDKVEYQDLVVSHYEDAASQALISDIYDHLTENEQNVLTDVLSGYTKLSLREKYRRFDYILEDIKDKIEYYYRQSGTRIPSSITNRKIY